MRCANNSKKGYSEEKRSSLRVAATVGGRGGDAAELLQVPFMTSAGNSACRGLAREGAGAGDFTRRPEAKSEEVALFVNLTFGILFT